MKSPVISYCQPVFEIEDTDGDSEASHLECPACGIREIEFVGPPKIEHNSLGKLTRIVHPLTCMNGPPKAGFRHRFDLIITHEDGEMLARCRVYPPYKYPGKEK